CIGEHTAKPGTGRFEFGLDWRFGLFEPRVAPMERRKLPIPPQHKRLAAVRNTVNMHFGDARLEFLPQFENEIAQRLTTPARRIDCCLVCFPVRNRQLAPERLHFCQRPERWLVGSAESCPECLKIS